MKAADTETSSSAGSTWEEESSFDHLGGEDKITMDNGTEINFSGPVETVVTNVSSSMIIPVSSIKSTPIYLNEPPTHAMPEHDAGHEHKALVISQRQTMYDQSRGAQNIHVKRISRGFRISN